MMIEWVFYLLLSLLNRLAQTLLLVPYVHWIIVEDAEQNSKLVKNLLAGYGLDKRSTLLYAKTPSDFKLKKKVRFIYIFDTPKFVHFIY